MRTGFGQEGTGGGWQSCSRSPCSRASYCRKFLKAPSRHSPPYRRPHCLPLFPCRLPPAVSVPIPSSGVSAPAGYILTSNDQVAVEVFGEDDLRANGRLNGEGNLSVPLLGSIHLAGLTLPQAASKLTDLYGRDYLVNPKVNVILIGYAKRRFSMLGQVNRPGSYEMPDGSPGGIDLLEAIAMAGGYTRIAAPERVTIRRHPATGSDQFFKVNAKRITKGFNENFCDSAFPSVILACRIRFGPKISL
ncbi:MAG: hypothetical protein DME75_07175 [Verrucomicrobia bacterium]|nr:MAG: hypothetical protein DME75_07175 [Verrucomicrobiota bacterium]